MLLFNMIEPLSTSVLVVGAGPVGLLAALEISARDLPVVLAGPRGSGADSPNSRAQASSEPRPLRLGRTAALFMPSLVPLARACVLERLGTSATSISSIHILDATGGPLTAPTVTFAASEIGLDELGRNIPLPLLTAALEAAVERESRIIRVPTSVASYRHATTHVEARLADGRSVQASLIVAAEGRASPARDFASIGAETWDYGQVALTAWISHARPHDGVSTELHRRVGPLTTVPLEGNASSLVWVETPAAAASLKTLSNQEFARRLERDMHGHLGTITGVADRQSFPLKGLRASALARDRVLLVGESAHVLPPIGAQGLNLSIRDVIDLADVLALARQTTSDLGSNAVLAEYARRRLRDVVTRVSGVDLFNRSLSSAFPFLPAARGLALSLLNLAPALRRNVIAAGLGLT